jgi:DNA-binding XRE family transcriptional regulator
VALVPCDKWVRAQRTRHGDHVRCIRQERQLSQGGLARAAGLAKQTLANLENGTGNPTVSSGTLHHVYVISGAVLAGPAEEVQALDRGDFIRFPGDVPHVLRSSSARALVHILTTVPQVQQFTH